MIMEINEEQARPICWMLSEIIDNLDTQDDNGFYNSKIEIGQGTLRAIRKVLLNFNNEVLSYDSASMRDNVKKIESILLNG